jgi:hypothetical protein
VILTFHATQPHPVTVGGETWITVDLDGALSPLRGPLPGRLAAFGAPAPAGRQRVPQSAFVAIVRRAAVRPANRATPRVRRERVPAGAFVPVTPAPSPPGPRPHPIRAGRAPIVLSPPTRRRMPRRHKLMLALAVEVLFVGAARARQQYRPPAVLIEEPVDPDNAIALNGGAQTIALARNGRRT